MSLKKALAQQINKLPYVNGIYNELNNFKRNTKFSAGHYNSTIYSIDDIKERENVIWKGIDYDGIDGIDFNTNNQHKLLQQLSEYYAEMPFEFDQKENLRYYFNNGYYTYTDAILLYSLIRHFKPKKIIEVGSGYSSSAMLDTNEIFFNNKIASV